MTSPNWIRMLYDEFCFVSYYKVNMEKEMATHSNTLAWEIPRKEESGRLQSMGHKELDSTTTAKSVWLETEDQFSQFGHSLNL